MDCIMALLMSSMLSSPRDVYKRQDSLQPDLTDGLEKRLALNVAGRAADLRDNDVGVRLAADTINLSLIHI